MIDWQTAFRYEQLPTEMRDTGKQYYQLAEYIVKTTASDPQTDRILNRLLQCRKDMFSLMLDIMGGKKSNNGK